MMIMKVLAIILVVIQKDWGMGISDFGFFRL
jgi:hypothetical protein